MSGAGRRESADGTGISVVIPTYNSVEHLLAVLDSIYGQTLQPVEIIIADDGSTDGTPELIETMTTHAPIPLRLVRAERNSGGPARPLNRGVAVAKGELIATLDHNDLMRPTKLERQLACWRADPTFGLVFSRCTRSFRAGGTKGQVVANVERILGSLRRRELAPHCFRIEAAEAFAHLMSCCFVVSRSSLLFSKAIWTACGGVDEAFAMMCDYQFALSVAEDHAFGFVDEELFDWTEHESSLTAGENPALVSDERIRYLTALHGRSRVGNKQLVRAKLSRELFDAAHEARERGCYRESLGRHLQMIRGGHLSLKVLLGIAKLFPHRLFRAGLSLRQGPGPVERRSFTR